MSYWILSACLFLLTGLTDVSSIRCYECGTGDYAQPCDYFRISPLWRPFEVECPSSPPHICVKTVNQRDPPSEVRSCSPAENAQQARHPLGCGRTSLSETVFCLCDTDLCNNSPSLGSASLFLPICLLLSTTANLSL